MINKNSSKLFLKQRIFVFSFVKRFIDIASAIIFLTLFSPLLIIISILIKLGSEGPILIRQRRVGRGGEFIFYKFRSMYNGYKYKNDMDAFLRDNYPDLWKQYIANGWKLPMNIDPRITPIGKFIRSTSIDEAPQFINVLLGQMSLVGPRAYRKEELDEYRKRYPKAKKNIDIIMSAKPGITGLWQTSGRNEMNFEQRAELDAKYIQNRSLRQELLIILKTPFVMLSIW
ncbi:MAG: sugar transferase [Candidatus Shapirobacteria bacterium]|nr:sugar transferase [Candidatus Shapirobacteria bacterium]